MLPSQAARPTSSRSHMYRRHRSRRLPAIIVGLLLVAGVIAMVKWMRGSGEPANAIANEPAVSPAVVERPSPSTANNPPPPVNRTSAPPTTKSSEPTRTALVPPSTSVPAQSPSQSPTSSSMTSQASTPTSAEQKISMGGSLPAVPAPQPPASGGAANPETPNREPAKSSPDLSRPMTAGGTSANPASKSTPPSTPTGTPTLQRLKAGLDLIAQNKPVEARAMLSAAMFSTGITPADAELIRNELTKLNQRLIFGPEIVPGDPFVTSYVIEAGDSLAKLPRKLSLQVDWRFLQRINNIAAPERIRVGQRIKVVKGPFHAIVHKPSFRMDLYMGNGSDRVYVRSFKVGLGEFGATPEGEFIVKQNSKLVDPAWTNPRTGEFFASGDPNNPLGKFWIGLIGISENIRDLETYGIHGTIEPDSIGQLRSMGCVRMLADDIAMVYEVLMENVSRVEIHGEDYP